MTLAALDAGSHVFVEKPMCITLADADAIVEARDSTGKVVQVGYMKRYDRAGRARCSRTLPQSAADRSVTSASWCTTPNSCRSSRPARSFAARTFPPNVLEAGREQRRAGRKRRSATSPASDHGIRGRFLGSLVHDVNVVHGVLERLGEPLPAEVVDG